ncbi:MAG TPA: hypothetical protein VIL46_15140 [Gemmataceae bacterium]
MLQQALRGDLAAGGHGYLLLGQLVASIEERYLKRWAEAVASPTFQLGTERTARAIAAHLLDSGLSPDYLHRWWTYRVRHEPAQRSLADLVAEAHELVRRDPKEFEVLVAFEAAPRREASMPMEWLEAPQVSEWLKKHGSETSNIRQGGGLLLRLKARDPWSAVEQAVEVTERVGARLAIGARGRLVPLKHAWVKGEHHKFPFRRSRRLVEVHALEREQALYLLTSPSRIDQALELLAPLDEGAPGPAVSGGWAAIETLLVGPGDAGERVVAGDRLATLVACSFPRAELTTLAYVHCQTAEDDLARQITNCVRNLDRAKLAAKAITGGSPLSCRDGSDVAARERMSKLLSNPGPTLREVERYVRNSLHRLYRQRNLVLHWGRTEAVALRACLRTAAPLVGAGIDRIVHAALVQQLSPLELAAQASVQTGLVGTSVGRSPLELLE